jgi:hypothetical protein
MSETQRQIIRHLYEVDPWADYVPSRPACDYVDGWNGNHPSLSRLVGSTGANVVIDLGVWKGQSSITLARAMKEAGIEGCVIGIDTFLGSSEHWRSDMSTFTRRHGMPDLYRTFMDNVFHAGVADYVVPLPQTASAAALILERCGIRATIAHIDAAHEYREVLQDIEAYWNLLLPGGFLIGDDYVDGWPGVIRAAGEFSARHVRPLTIEPPKWILQKP